MGYGSIGSSPTSGNATAIMGKTINNTDVPVDNEPLSFDSASDKWQAGGGATAQTVVLGANFTNAAAAYTDITGFTVTMPTRTRGKALICCSVSLSNSVAGNQRNAFRLVDNATAKHEQSTVSPTTNLEGCIPYFLTVLLSGQVVKGQLLNSSGGGTSTVYGTAPTQSHLATIEVG